MGLIEEEFSNPLISGINKGKRNKTRNIRIGIHREKFIRVARGSPEVLVKISGFTKGSDHLKAHMTYITRNGKIDLEDQNGAAFKGLEEVNTLVGMWDQTINQARMPKANSRDAVKMVLSMPPGTDPKAVRDAVRAFAQSEFENHDYVFALHTDEAHPHVHLTVQMRGFDGNRLNPRKADLQRWREGFAHSLLNEGVDCVATPRTARNRNRGQSQSRRHADERRKKRGQGIWQGESHPYPGTFKDRSKAEWEAIRERCRKIVRAAWLSAALELESGVERFGMPKPHYKRYERHETGRRRWRRDAALYQSGARNAGGTREARTLVGVRDVPGGEVVRHRDSAQGVLQGVPRHRLGRSPEAHPDLRRERDLVGPDGAGLEGLEKTAVSESSVDQVMQPKDIRSVRRFAERLRGQTNSEDRERVR